MLAAHQLTRAYGSHVVLRAVDLQLSQGMRVGVIGANGSGKTTLLELLAGLEDPDGGAVVRDGGVTVGYARQDVTGIRGQRVLDAVLEAAEDVVETEQAMRDLEQRMAAPDPSDDQDALLQRYGTLQDRYANAAGYSLEARVRKVLAGLGFSDAAMQADITTLSGGWMMRVALARLLLRTPDVLLLDEPTNHLDFVAAEWLAEYVAGYAGAVVAVSHDRWFLDQIATHILELDGKGGARVGVGTYSSWVVEREIEREQLEAAASNQARKIAQTQAFVERFRAKATKARQVQSRIKALDKIERVEVPTTVRPRLRLALPVPPRSGRVVAQLQDIAKRYGDVEVFGGADLVVERGRKIAVLGPNGAGKSTLLRLIAGIEQSDRGVCELGHNVTAAYFAQHHTDVLDTGRTVLAELDQALHDRSTNPRSILGAFGFPGETVDKLVGQCSGGERARLALAKLVVGPANLLCLDEPTNHLDLHSRELLTAALDAYEGTVLLVTHDRALVRAVADGICAVGGGRAVLRDGDLDVYLASQRADAKGVDGANGAAAVVSLAQVPRARSDGASGVVSNTANPGAAHAARGAPVDRRQQRREAADLRRRTQTLRNDIATAERELEQAEARLSELESALADPTTYEDPEAGRELTMEHALVSDRVNSAEQHWEQLVEQLERFEAAESS